ncbi:hypothetical protein D9M68_380350 [compost metagenome]
MGALQRLSRPQSVAQMPPPLVEQHQHDANEGTGDRRQRGACPGDSPDLAGGREHGQRPASVAHGSSLRQKIAGQLGAAVDVRRRSKPHEDSIFIESLLARQAERG